MFRRRYLSLCTVAVAGCSAGDDDDEPSTTEAVTGERTGTRSATATNSATATRTPNEAIRAGNEAIAEIQSSLDAIVRQYAGSESDDILDMNVTTEFNSTLIDNTLRETTKEVEVARERAVTDAQRQTVELLAGAVRFFVIATNIQGSLTGAFADVQAGRRALNQEDPSDIRDAIRGINAETSIAREPFENLQSETSREDFGPVERLSPETYDAKVAQFDAELGGLSRLTGTLDGIAADINQLLQARTDQEAGDDPTESAQAAIDGFTARAERLANLASGLPPAGAALEPVIRDFAALASQKADAAREIREAN